MTESTRAVSRFARIPFDPARLPFYYGWVMVPAAVIALVAWGWRPTLSAAG